MKKKLLSLLMAGAMTLGTVIPVYADAIYGDDNLEHSAEVKVQGMVSSADGTAPAGKIQVEIPTNMSFTVNDKGELTAGAFNVQNKGQTAIDIMVGSFQETKVESGITVHKEESALNEKDRSNITLKLKGNTAEINLGDSEFDKKTVISKIGSGESDSLHLTGKAGTAKAAEGVDKSGESEDFKLVFKIKKSQDLK